MAECRIDGTLRFSSYSIAAAAGDAFLVRLMRTDATTGFKPRAEIYDPQGRLASVGATTLGENGSEAATAHGASVPSSGPKGAPRAT